MYLDVDQLIVWQKAHALVLEVYKFTQNFPKQETYGLVSQMQRSAVSIPCNISEGKGRGSKKDYIRFLMIARGSLEELRYQLLLSKDLAYISVAKYNETEPKLIEIRKMLNALITQLRN